MSTNTPLDQNGDDFGPSKVLVVSGTNGSNLMENMKSLEQAKDKVNVISRDEVSVDATVPESAENYEDQDYDKVQERDPRTREKSIQTDYLKAFAKNPLRKLKGSPLGRGAADQKDESILISPNEYVKIWKKQPTPEHELPQNKQEVVESAVEKCLKGTTCTNACELPATFEEAKSTAAFCFTIFFWNFLNLKIGLIFYGYYHGVCTGIAYRECVVQNFPMVVFPMCCNMGSVVIMMTGCLLIAIYTPTRKTLRIWLQICLLCFCLQLIALFMNLVGNNTSSNFAEEERNSTVLRHKVDDDALEKYNLPGSLQDEFFIMNMLVTISNLYNLIMFIFNWGATLFFTFGTYSFLKC